MSFPNNAYGGPVNADRNLYVKRITQNTVPVAGATASLYSNGTAHFTLSVPIG